jgi:hypothetical protein
MTERATEVSRTTRQRLLRRQVEEEKKKRRSSLAEKSREIWGRRTDIRYPKA